MKRRNEYLRWLFGDHGLADRCLFLCWSNSRSSGLLREDSSSSTLHDALPNAPARLANGTFQKAKFERGYACFDGWSPQLEAPVSRPSVG